MSAPPTSFPSPSARNLLMKVFLKTHPCFFNRCVLCVRVRSCAFVCVRVRSCVFARVCVRARVCAYVSSSLASAAYIEIEK